MGRREREVEMAESVRQHRSLGDVAGVVGDSPVEVVDDPYLQWGGDQVEEQADHQGFGDPRIAFELGDAPDDDASDGEEDYRDEERGDRLRGHRRA
jgi:hypothetical protein